MTVGLKIGCVSAALLSTAIVAATNAAEPTALTHSNGVSLVVRSYPLNSYCRDLDGQWEGIRLASDGNCYFASSTHSARHGADFFEYNPGTKKLTLLCNDI